MSDNRSLSTPAIPVDEWDLFISYRHHDKVDEAVDIIHEELESEFREGFNHNLRIYFDRSDIRGFNDWMVRCYRSLRSSRFFLACISPKYLESDACRWEWEEWQKRELESGHAGSGSACVWFVEPSELKSQVANERAGLWLQDLYQRHGVELRDWRDHGPPAARGEATRAPLRELCYYIAQRLRLFSLSRIQGGNMRLPSEHFVGRGEELSQIATLFSSSNPSGIVGLSGIGGIGKSEIALRYAFDHAGDYPGGRWLLPAKGGDAIAAVIRSLQFYLQIKFSESEAKDDFLAARRIVAELHRRGRALLVIDDVDNSALLARGQTVLFPNDDSLRVLFTTRLGLSAFADLPAGSAVIAVNKLSEPEALDLIRGHQAGNHFAAPDDESSARQIAHMLDGLAIAVETVAIYLGRYAPGIAPPEKVVSIPQYEEQLRRDLLPNFMERLHSSTTQGIETQAISQLAEITAVTKATFERLSYEAGTVVGLASLLPPNTIVLDWLQSTAAKFHHELKSETQPGESSPWRDIVQELISQRILLPSARPGVFVMHPLLQGAFRRLLENDLDVLEGMWVDTILNAFTLAKADWRNPEIHWQFDAFAWIAKRWASELIEPQLKLAAHVGAIYRELGEYSSAEDLLRYVLQFASTGDERPHPDTYIVVMALASILRDTNRASEAAELLRGHPQQGISQGGNSAVSLMPPLEPILEIMSGLSDPEEAIQFGKSLLEDTLARHEPGLLEKVIANFAVAGGFLGQQGQSKEAEALMWLALSMAENAYGSNNIETALPRNNLGQYLQSVGKLDKAERLLRKNVELWERQQPPMPKPFAISLHNLALVLTSLGMSAEAESYERRGLDILERDLGNIHPDLAPFLAGIASTLGRQNKYKEALVHLRRQFILLTKFSIETGHEHTYFKKALHDYTTCLSLAGYTPDEIAKELERASTEGGLSA